MEQLITVGKKHIQNNTKKEVVARMTITIATILMVFMTYFMVNGWAQSIFFYRFITEETKNANFNLISKIAGAVATVLILFSSLAVIIPINRLKTIESLKYAIITIGIAISIYFLITIIVSIYFMSIYSSNELIIGFNFYIVCLAFILFGLTFFWFEVKRQKLIFSALIYQQESNDKVKEK